MAVTMDRAEREGFLAGAHVGIMSITEAGRAPLCSPVWYDFEPGSGVWVITHPSSRKGKLLAEGERYSLCAQNESPPAYQYVSVEGPLVETRKAELEKDYRPMSRRYLGAGLGDRFAEASWNDGFCVYVMRPERWLSGDYGKDELLGGATG